MLFRGNQAFLIFCIWQHARHVFRKSIWTGFKPLWPFYVVTWFGGLSSEQSQYRHSQLWRWYNMWPSLGFLCDNATRQWCSGHSVVTRGPGYPWGALWTIRPSFRKWEEVPTQWKFIYYLFEGCWNNKTSLTDERGLHKEPENILTLGPECHSGQWVEYFVMGTPKEGRRQRGHYKIN